MSMEHDEKKGAYESIAAGLDSNSSNLEQVTYMLMFLLFYFEQLIP